MLIDTGSTVDVLFRRAIEVLGLVDSIKALTTTITGFNGFKESATGEITLPIQAGSETTFVKFLVIDAESKYLGILGRNWLHSIKAIPSTYHFAIHFPTDHGVYEIKGSQAITRMFWVQRIYGLIWVMYGLIWAVLWRTGGPVNSYSVLVSDGSVWVDRVPRSGQSFSGEDMVRMVFPGAQSYPAKNDMAGYNFLVPSLTL
ncbi:hypothetical protein GIB67_011403 [Kingdonia uniflora]|uniref:Peptidase A2 domain-containing protein n=1 Tax=Kingdonia uniflora TaxID=39325 RepID=A0A7J7NM53_9MAGN|nr:hypothetical protein GIB67_011403 [Kingdonia uniflora]